VHVHAIGASKVGAQYEIERVNPEDQENTKEPEAQPVGPKEHEEEVKCPSHEPTSFVIGKPRSIISLLFILPSMSKYVNIYCCITYRSCMKPLLHYIFPCLDILPYPGIESGSSSSLGMLKPVEVG